MTTPAELQTSVGEKVTAAANRDDLYGARLFVSDARRALSDVRLAFLLTDEAYGGVVAKVFGIPREKQSPLVKLMMASALAAVLRGYAPQLPRPSRSDAVMGGSVLNTALRGIAGAPSRTIPAAGVVIGLAVLGHGIRRGIRSTAVTSARDVHAAVHGAEARYGRRPATSVAGTTVPVGKGG